MKTKLLGSLAIVLSVFLLAGTASASTTEILQPASDITYNENVDINGSLNVDSLRVGTAGSGGVTFFNGTVLNEGIDPFTVGDDMRVDGEIWRGSKGGDPVKFSDNVIPTLTNMNDLGSSSKRWNHFYSVQGNFSGNLHVNGVTGLTDADIPNTLTASNYLPLSGGTLNGNLSVNGINGLVDSDIPNTITVENYLPLEGGLLTGGLTVNGVTGLLDDDIPNTITASNYLQLTGGILSGGLTVNGVTGLIDSDIPDNLTASNYLQLAGGTLTGALTVNGVSGLLDSDIPDTITASNYLQLAGGTLTGALTVNGVSGLLDSDIPDTITASNYLLLTGGTITGSLIVNSDIIQDIDNNGAVKAMVNADSAGGCKRTWASWAAGTTTPISCTRVRNGSYEIDFPFDVNDRYWQATTESAMFTSATSSATSSDKLYVNIHALNGQQYDSDFMLNIY